MAVFLQMFTVDVVICLAGAAIAWAVLRGGGRGAR
jgi:hypothetical protein